jgi:hypothetical protein
MFDPQFLHGDIEGGVGHAVPAFAGAAAATSISTENSTTVMRP